MEFAIAAVPILLIGLGGIELAQWFTMKQALSLALLEAARAGIVQHARPQAMKEAFEIALRPLYPSATRHTPGERVRQILEERRKTTLPAPWRIHVVNPSAAAFSDFADSGLEIARKTGRRAIDNHYQRERHAARHAAGWPGGVGPESGQTLYQANTLTLELIYPVEPLVPGLRPLLQLLEAGSGYAARALAAGYLPITQEIHLTMQSHPVDWPDLADGTVVHGHVPREATSPPTTPATCHGIWCPPSSGTTAGGQNEPPGSGGLDPKPPVNEPAVGTPTQPPASEGAAGGVDAPAGDPACGVTLCCVT